jgi:hypothetical protein
MIRMSFMAALTTLVVLHNEVTIQEVDEAIRWLTRGGPANPMQARPELRVETARSIHAAASENDLDPYLLAAMSFRESSFRLGARGALGEIGLMQIHGSALRKCRDLDMTLTSGQAMCGARHLRAMADHCGDITSGLTAYASGSCIARTDKTSRLVANRLRMAQRLASKPWEE